MITPTTRKTAAWFAGGVAAAALVLGSAGVAFASQGADDAAPHATRTAAPLATPPAAAPPVAMPPVATPTAPVTTVPAPSTTAPAPVADDHGGLRTTPEAVHHHRGSGHGHGDHGSGSDD